MNRIASAGLVALGIAIGAGGMAAGQAVLEQPRADTQPQPLGALDLKNEFPGLDGYILYLGKTVVPPGAGKVVHTHHNAPEIEHIVSGVLTDQRNGGPITDYGPGQTMVNDKTTTHSYVNRGKEPVVFYIAAIRKPKAP